MDRHGGQTSSAGRSLKRKLEQRFQDQARACKVLAVEKPKKEGSSTAFQSNSSTTTTSFSGPHRDYDVFMSFRGEDTRKNFTDHLYNALVRVGIHTFRDEEELERGKTISVELLSAIRRSKISIVVFSKDYASSSWCLDELVEILHCRKTMDHTLLPIFYDVDPSDVRKQAGNFAKAFEQHERRFQTEMEKVQRWREALTEAANCSGWDLQSLANGYKSSFIEKIVVEVSCIMKPDELKVARYPIGINCRVERIVNLLNLGTNDVHIVGIYGTGGIGKTTLAKAVYNQVRCGFEGSSCLLNIKQNSKQPMGLVCLQKQLLYDILKIKDLKIANVDHGINLIEKRIYGKKVLIVLDDVDNQKQLYELLGSSKKFGSGSKVLATTRDEVMLTNLGVQFKYEVEKLEEEESFQLFNLNAFNTSYPKQDYKELSIDVVKYCGGLPLALEVLGCSLIGRTVADWKMELGKLQRTPHPKIQKVLHISFESLDNTVKNIFLDIACFFVGKDKDYVIKILDGCNFILNDDINTLIWRSLVTIDLEKKLMMHDLIRDMGRHIVQEESLNYPGERSRLWFHEDILNVLYNHTGTKIVEGIISNLSIFEDVHLETETFTNMKRLRLLQINGVHLKGSYEYLSKELRLLCWHKCPLKFLPENFHLENLVILDMQHSNIQAVWKNNKKVNKLKFLNLKDCKYLTKSPDFSQVPQLEVLILEGCINLVQVHESIVILKSLEVLNLSGCLKLQKLLKDLESMMALKQLLANGTAIRELPSSIVSLRNLEVLQLSKYAEQSSKSLWSRFLLWMSPKRLKPINLLPASISGLYSLKELNLSNCNLSGIPKDLGSLCSLQVLNLSRNNFRILPNCISHLSNLTFLWLYECTSLQSISELPPRVHTFNARDCTSLKRFSLSLTHGHAQLIYLHNCSKLTKIQGLKRLALLDVSKRNNLAHDFWSQIQVTSTLGDGQFCNICLPSDVEVPYWLSHQSNGRSISFHVPSSSKVEDLRLFVCRAWNQYCSSVIIRNKSRGYEHICPNLSAHSTFFHEGNVTLYQTRQISNVLKIESGDEIEVSLKDTEFMNVRWGVHVLFIEPNQNEEHEIMVTMMKVIYQQTKETILPNIGLGVSIVWERIRKDLILSFMM